MTIRDGKKRHWVWIKLVGRRVCATQGCHETIKRITWVHPRPREEYCAGTDGTTGGHVVPQPLSRRCYSCGAATFETVRIANLLYGSAARVPPNEIGALRQRRGG